MSAEVERRAMRRLEEGADHDRETVAYAIAWSEGATLAESRRSLTARDDVWDICPWRSPVVGARDVLARAVRMLG